MSKESLARWKHHKEQAAAQAAQQQALQRAIQEEKARRALQERQALNKAKLQEFKQQKQQQSRAAMQVTWHVLLYMSACHNANPVMYWRVLLVYAL